MPNDVTIALRVSDHDLWGLQTLVTHALMDGYLDENREWGAAMLERIEELREALAYPPELLSRGRAAW
ncbi:hypothetical protein LCGC14_1604490 [marine sediment metagenome]|uniref:Uncharacterized protein n=1 Tax=marine sediment metagenome TaxID=412755 RepID=A0A0F9KQW7_9ZZZZ